MTVAAGSTGTTPETTATAPGTQTTPAASREGLRAVTEQLMQQQGQQQAPANGQAPADGQQQPAAGIGHNQGPDWLPDGVPEAMRGKDAKETIGRLTAALPQVPKAPTDYKLELSGEVAKLAGDLSQDAVLPIAQKIAHKAGLTNTQFSAMVGELYAELNKQGMLQPPIDIAGELEKLKPRTGTPSERLVAAEKRLLGAQGVVTRLQQGGILSKTEANNLLAITVVADGITAIEKLGKLILTEDGVRGGGAAAGTTDAASAHERAMAAMYPSMAKKAS